MTYSHSPLAFSDCYEALDAALKDPKGVRIPTSGEDAAYRLRARVHQARTIDRKRNQKIYSYDDPMYGRSEYDGLTCRIQRHGGVWYVYIEQVTGLLGEAEPLSELEEIEPNEPVFEAVAGKIVRRV